MKRLSTRRTVVLTPIRLGQKPIPKVWGGRALKSVFGFSLPPGVQVGESWLLYDRADGSSETLGDARDLRSLMREHASDILGEGVAAGFDGRFPLMLKLIDAQEQLSLQVHPDGKQARCDGDGGKHEASVVLQAGPDARMVSGLRPGVTREQLLDAIDCELLDPVIRSYRPRVGDCFDVPAGTVHAIGPGVLLFEVQQNSNLTYRLHDWGRTRSVHTEKAVGVMSTGRQRRPVPQPKPIPGGGFLLTENPWFRVRRYQSAAGATIATSHRFLTLTVVGGSGCLEWEGQERDEAMNLLPGDTILVPACISSVQLKPDVSLDVIACDPGRAAGGNSVRAAG